MTAQQANTTRIQAYQRRETPTTLLTNGHECWDISFAKKFISITGIMDELAHGGDTSDWPLSQTPWHNYRERLEDGNLTLLAELLNPGQEDEAFSIPAAARTNPTVKNFLVDPAPRNCRNWKHLLVWLGRADQLREIVQDPAQPLTQKAANPTGADTPWGKVLESHPAGNGVWQVKTESGRTGLMLSPELIAFLPYEIQTFRTHRLFAMEDKEVPIMSVVLGIDNPRSFNTAVNIAKRYHNYGPILPYLMDTVPQVHYHVHSYGNRHRMDKVGTFKSHLDAWSFCQNPDNIQEYGNDMVCTQCSGETCDWLRLP